MTRQQREPDFVACTANVHYSAKPGEVRDLVKHLRDEESCDLIFGQEMSKPQQRNILRALGYDFVWHPRQFVVAFLPDVWSLSRERGYDLGPSYGSASDKKDSQRTGVQMAVLTHRQTDMTLKAYSAHPPSGVQRPGGPNDEAPKRLEALKYLVRHLERKCERTRTDGFLVGLDDNVDETRQPKHWDFMPPSKGPDGTLKQCQPPVGSHGTREERGRKIDPFYFDGLYSGDGKVLWDLAPGDHGPHLREWFWDYTSTRRKRPS